MNLPPGRRIAVIIVNWNRKSRLAKNLESLERYLTTPHRVLVVDNASTDGSPDMVRSRFPRAQLLENPRNLGFARANNLALDLLRGQDPPPDYVLFLNNDAELTDGSLDGLIAHLDANPGISAAGPAVWTGEGRPQTGAAGYDLSLGSALAYFLFLSRIPFFRRRGLFLRQEDYLKRRSNVEVDWISGVCLVARERALRHSGGFSEDTFMYAEDVALGRELRRHGPLVYFPGARVLHHRDPRAASPGTLWLDSLFLYYRKTRGAGGAALLLLKAVFWAGFGLRGLAYAFPSRLPEADRRRGRREMRTFRRHIAATFFRLDYRTRDQEKNPRPEGGKP